MIMREQRRQVGRQGREGNDLRRHITLLNDG